MAKIKLMITDTAPLYPPLWGGPQRIWNLYGNLSQDLFDITYVGVKFGMPKEQKYSLQRIRKNFVEILCNLPPHYPWWHTFERKVFPDTSLDLFVYLCMRSDWQFKYILNLERADVVICSHPWASRCINKLSRQIFIYDAHNCEYLLMGQILKNHPLKLLIMHMVKKIEGDACRKSDLILACSENEKNDLMQIYKVDPNKIMVITNGANPVYKIPLSEKQMIRRSIGVSESDKVVLFIGANYKPNIDAVQCIVSVIAPKMEAFTFLIAGSVQEAFKKGASFKNVRFLGQLSTKKMHSVLSASDIAINPMFSGSGINIKMLDYMAYGLPIVTTECGFRGIDVQGLHPALIMPVDNFAEGIRKLMENPQLSMVMGEEGRLLVRQYYDWKLLSNKIQDEVLNKQDTVGI
jgi:glycosyltransferase involved in cell wall biosynthesis